MKINYLTSNNLKFEIAQRFFAGLEDYELVRHSFPVPEVQEMTCEAVALESAAFAAKELGEPCIVMDAGFFIEALNGFPGPFVKYTNEWLSEAQLLRMLMPEDTRAAYFLDALAIGFPDGTAKVFSHKTPGSLAIDGQYTPSKWPANSLFIPENHTSPLGQMSDEEQANFWQQENKTWNQLIDFLAQEAVS